MELSRRRFLALAGAAGLALPMGSRRITRTRTNPAGLIVTSQFHVVDGTIYGTGGWTTPRSDTAAKIAAAGLHGFRIDTGYGSWFPNSSTQVPASTVHSGRVAGALDFAEANGLKVLVTAHEAPSWWRTAGETDVKTLPTDPAKMFAAGAFLAETLSGWTCVKAIEPWNEPNLTGFDSLGPRPGHWMECQEQFYLGVKSSANPSMPVLFPAPDSIAYKNVDDGDDKANWIRECWQYQDANSMSRSYDVLSVHCYPVEDAPSLASGGTSTWRLRQLDYLLPAMASRGEGAVPVWITEWGYSRHDDTTLDRAPFPWELGMPEIPRAQYSIDFIEYVQNNYPQVAWVSLYNELQKTNDPDSDTTCAARHQNGFGVLRFSVPAARSTADALYSELSKKLGGSAGDLAGLKTNDLEGGSNTTAVSVANSGGGRRTPFGTPVGTVTYSSTAPAHGSLSLQAVLAAGTASYAPWPVAGQVHTFRCYYTPTSALPSFNMRLAKLVDSGGTTLVDLRHASSGAIDVQVAGAGSFPTTAAAFASTSTTYRIEVQLSATSATLLIYDDDTTTLLASSTVSSLSIAAAAELRWGLMANASASGTVRLDDLAYRSDGRPIGAAGV